MLEKIIEAVFAAFLVIALFVIMPILVAIMGGFGAWACGLLFEDTIRGVLRTIGVNLDAFSMFQIGATLGFIGSYFRTTFSSTK